MEHESVCVLGLGYIGLPTASLMAISGLKVLGVDVDPHVLTTLREGLIQVQEPGLSEIVGAAFQSDNLTVSDHPEPSDAFIIAVPTPIKDNKSADLSFVEAAAEAIVPHLREGNLVILESTCPPRTTVDRVAPLLERSGLQAGADFFLAYTPERALPGQILKELVENDRVIGGIDGASAEAARELYAVFVTGDMVLTDATTAEMVKLMENAYRDINIAAANEFSELAEGLGINVWEAINMANRHPRVKILQPGPGVGGHCTGIDPWFLVEVDPEHTPVIRQARARNDAQPAHAVGLVELAGGDLSNQTIAALGLAYKPNVGDLRESPAVEIVRRLVATGATVHTFEPFSRSAAVEGASARHTVDEALAGADMVVLLVNHSQFVDLDPRAAAREMAGRLAVDLRGAWKRVAWEAAGFEVHTLGVGTRNA